MSDFGEGKNLQARKPHRCEWCYQKIETGETCYHFKGMWQGDWQDWYMHLECKGSYALNNDPDGFTPGEGERPKKENSDELSATV
jgi:hypothetical protein